jgi:hypothetical protein
MTRRHRCCSCAVQRPGLGSWLVARYIFARWFSRERRQPGWTFAGPKSSVVMYNRRDGRFTGSDQYSQ